MNEPVRRLSFSEYAQLEALDERSFEFFEGEVIALAASSLTHGNILSNVRTALEPAARARGCRVYSGDATVESGERCSARPDLVITCDEFDRSDASFGRRGAIRYPFLVIEVLSPATAARDTNEKVDGYAAIETVEQYVIVDSRRQRITLYERKPDGFVYYGEVRSVVCPRLDVILSLETVYAGISVAALDPLQP